MLSTLKKITIGYTVAALVAVGCNQHHNNADSKTASTTTPHYTLQAPLPISTAEKQALQYKCNLFYDSMLNKSGFNGGMIVAKDGNIIFEKYKGSINLDDKVPITDSTPLHIASVSKTFTAMAVLKLQQQQQLNINDLFSKYFPAFNYEGVTIKSLLNHRSGLPNYLYFMEDLGWPKDSLIHNNDVLNWLIQKKDSIKNIAPANKHFTYCNTNYALLALLIEKVSGQTYPQFIQQQIFDAIGMQHSFVHFTNDGKIRSKTFDWKGREIPDNNLDEVYGDKNIYSTPKDLLMWDKVLRDTQFLPATYIQMAYEPYSNEKAGIKNYGLGWRMNNYDDGKKIIFHNGWWHGNNASFIRLIKENATIIVISNRFTRNVYKAKLLANIFNHFFDTDVEENESAATTNMVDTVASKSSKKVYPKKK
ncbi:serine hydrolase domain-containing protein [Ferruginibacter yonginensis]|uniref:Serine hydrolase domain-containing protein n=1 Tax=Ferruginibacter yonginensis TaxID=1310416 RepID=A0ABV8QPR5_9BACT